MGNLDANLDRLAALEGMGCSRKRREDPRFIQGKGTYVDDIKMPGMLFGVMVRSPYAHARVKKIDKSRALAHPGVHAVLTADDLKPLKLHWMPTLAGDVQAVLADEKVCFQNQEVAFVVADDRYVAADAAELVEVEYEELPAVVDPLAALAADAPVIREDIRDKPTGAHGARRHPNHIFTWNIGDKDKTDRVFEHADVTVKQQMLYPRVHPCPLETCGCVASFDKVRGDLTVYHHLAGAARGAHRGGLAVGDTRVENPHYFAGYRRWFWQQGRGLSGLCRVDRRFHCAGAAGQMDRVALGKPQQYCLCARLPDDGRTGRG